MPVLLLEVLVTVTVPVSILTLPLRPVAGPTLVTVMTGAETDESSDVKRLTLVMEIPLVVLLVSLVTVTVPLYIFAVPPELKLWIPEHVLEHSAVTSPP
jgi:hypothetical protein